MRCSFVDCGQDFARFAAAIAGATVIRAAGWLFLLDGEHDVLRLRAAWLWLLRQGCRAIADRVEADLAAHFHRLTVLEGRALGELRLESVV